MRDERDRFDEEERPPSKEFARMLEEFESARAAGTPPVGSKVRGRVVQISGDTGFVDFGGRSEGALELQPFLGPDGSVTLKIGDILDLFVVDDKDQILLAPSMRAEPAAALHQLREAQRAGMPVSGRVTGMNAGGLEVDIAGQRGFCPVSQIEAGYCADPSAFVGRTLEFLVTELAEGGKRLVVSRKALLHREEEEKRRRLLAALAPGQEIDGTVARVEPFGAFVDLGGVDGLIHVSEIAHGRIDHPRDILSQGQKVRVKVLDIKEGAGGRARISLSMKASQPDPWHEVPGRYAPGSIVTGTVARLADFGAFVTLSPGVDGLVHVSEIGLRPVAHPREALEVGAQVQARILSVEADRRRISLSIRDVLAAEAGEAPRGQAGAGTAAAEAKAPKAGDVADAWVAGIKPYGLFVDLPVYGHRARALVPAEETGERRGTDLTKRYRVGDQVRVEIVEVDPGGRIRASMTRAEARSAEEQFQAYRLSAEPKKASETALGEAFRRAMDAAARKKGT
jgi:small subunit ribosomal protein S1